MTAEKTEQGNSTLLGIEEDLPILAPDPLEGDGPSNFGGQVAFGRSSSGISGKNKLGIRPGDGTVAERCQGPSKSART